MPNTFETREQWLIAAARRFEQFFIDQGYPLPTLRVTCGFPSTRATGNGKRAIGQCWNPKASADKTTEVMVSPVLGADDPMSVIGTLFHELIHAAVGTECGHKGAFRKVAVAGGLEGKMTSTKEGDVFKARAQPILDDLGPFPHAKLDPSLSGKKKQSTRLIKCECSQCGYTVRVTAKWIAMGTPICPNEDEETGDSHGQMVAHLPDETDDDEG